MKKIIESLPLKIGDRAYTIVNYKGTKKIKIGVVSQMYFSEEMELVISVKNICRGLYGKKVFKTYLEAYEALGNTIPGDCVEEVETNHFMKRFNRVV